MNLVIDVGNSLIKFGVFNNNELIHKETAIKTEFRKTFSEISESFPEISKAIACLSGEFSEAKQEMVSKKYPLHILSHQSKVPFKNKYASPLTLGVDRIALITSAYRQYPDKNVLVIDAGTCVTYDFLDSSGSYRGGAISPGIRMRYEALSTFTARLPLLEPKLTAQITGDTTASAIHSGVIFGTVMEIDGRINHYREAYEDLTVILTGGDAHFLRDSIKNSIFANSNFLLEGLNCLLEFNQDK